MIRLTDALSFFLRILNYRGILVFIMFRMHNVRSVSQERLGIDVRDTYLRHTLYV